MWHLSTMTESQMPNRRIIIVILLCGLLLCTSAYALALDSVQLTGSQPESPVQISSGICSTLLAESPASPGQTPGGNAYAYGHDKDRTTQTPSQTPTVSATPTLIVTPTPTPTPTATPTRIFTTTPTQAPTTGVITTAPVTVAPTPVGTAAPTQPPVSPEPAKTVPLSGIIPAEAMPAAAAGSAIVLTGLFALFNSSVSSWGGQITSILKNATGGVITGKILDRDKERRTILSDETEKLYLGFSKKEILVLLAGTLIIGCLFLYADRQPFEPVMIAIYVAMGGLGLVIHELAHLYFERKFSCRTEIQFWGIGTIIMALTAWLFGNVFAQPFLTLVHSQQPLEKRTVGHMMLSGPAVSTVIAFLCLLLIPLGGLFRTAGMIGFVMNMVTAVFELLPIPPCEGKEIFTWNKLVWAVAFVPLFLIYLYMTM